MGNYAKFELLQYRKIRGIGAHVSRVISPEHSSDHTEPTLLANDTAREIWIAVLEKITRQGGPFVGAASTDQFDSTANVEVRLSPAGFPYRVKRWGGDPDGVDVSEYTHF